MTVTWVLTSMKLLSAAIVRPDNATDLHSHVPLATQQIIFHTPFKSKIKTLFLVTQRIAQYRNALSYGSSRISLLNYGLTPAKPSLPQDGCRLSLRLQTESRTGHSFTHSTAMD